MHKRCLRFLTRAVYTEFLNSPAAGLLAEAWNGVGSCLGAPAEPEQVSLRVYPAATARVLLPRGRAGGWKGQSVGGNRQETGTAGCLLKAVTQGENEERGVCQGWR